MQHGLWQWILFHIFIFILLTIDLGFFQKKSRAVLIKESLFLSLIWIIVALCFNIFVYFWFGLDLAAQFFTGYLVEKSLSIDNIFVFLLLFSFFKVPKEYQHRVLFWGILGALVMRGLMIAVGITLITMFHWILYIFGAFLVYTGIRMAFQEEVTDIHPEKNILVRLLGKVMRIDPQYYGHKFFIRKGNKVSATLLLLVLVVIESTDVIFAVDSIPAILGISKDPFIVYTSNVFAILGLRALYFALAGIIDIFQYLKYGLAIVLTFIGAKMILEIVYEIPLMISLGIIAGILIISAILSIVIPPKKN